MWKFLGVLLCSSVLAISAKTCTITLPADIKGFSPIILTKSSAQSAYGLFRPTGEVNTFAAGSAFQFVCTGAKNVIVPLGVTTLDLQCSSAGQFVDVNKNPVVLSTLVCKTIPDSTLKVTTTKCSKNRGLIYESGVTVAQKFYRIFELCYDKNTETTFYTHNTLHGAAIKYNIPEGARRPFQSTGMKYNTRTVSDIYAKKNQLIRFEKYFGKGQTFVDEKKNYLSRGHLSPDADFMFGYEQWSTYYYANVAPQFQPINGGNWLRVEDMSRSLAAAYGDDIESYNGYFGIVQYPRSTGAMVKVYLDTHDEFHIPKYYFKVLMRKSSDQSIVFVNVNNPHITAGQAEEVCPNVCGKANLNHKDFSNLLKGYTFCCSLADFKKVFDGLPNGVQGKKLLTAK